MSRPEPTDEAEGPLHPRGSAAAAEEAAEAAIDACIRAGQVFARANLVSLCLGIVIISMQIAALFLAGAHPECLPLEFSATAIASKVGSKVNRAVIAFFREQRYRNYTVAEYEY